MAGILPTSPPPRGFDAEELRDGKCRIRYRFSESVGLAAFHGVWLVGWLSVSGFWTLGAVLHADFCGGLFSGSYFLFGLVVAAGVVVERCTTVFFTLGPEELLVERAWGSWRRRRSIRCGGITAIRRREYGDKEDGQLVWTLTVVLDRPRKVLQSASFDKVEWLGRVLVRWSGVALTDHGGATLLTVEQANGTEDAIRADVDGR